MFLFSDVLSSLEHFNLKWNLIIKVMKFLRIQVLILILYFYEKSLKLVVYARGFLLQNYLLNLWVYVVNLRKLFFICLFEKFILNASILRLSDFQIFT